MSSDSHLLSTHSWTAVKLDLYGLKFFYRHFLNKAWQPVDLIKPPRTKRFPDVVTVAEVARLFSATQKLSYRIFYFVIYSLGHRSILTTGKYTHLTPHTAHNTDQVINDLMKSFSIPWGKVK